MRFKLSGLREFDNEIKCLKLRKKIMYNNIVPIKRMQDHQTRDSLLFFLLQYACKIFYITFYHTNTTLSSTYMP